MKTEAIHSKPKKILSDFESCHEWNPFIKNLEIELNEESRLIASIELPEREITGFKPALLNAEPNMELRWQGHLLSPEFLDGEHEHLVHKDPLAENIAMFTQAGVLAPILMERINDLPHGMNHALTLRHPAGHKGTPPGAQAGTLRGTGRKKPKSD